MWTTVPLFSGVAHTARQLRLGLEEEEIARILRRWNIEAAWSLPPNGPGHKR
jgi:hypothetical protein